VYNYWPPGMVVVDFLLLQIEAVTGLSIVSLMVVFNAAAWSMLLGSVFVVVRRRRGLVFAGLFALGVLLYSGVSHWALGTGLFYSDSFGALGFCGALLCLFLADERAGRRRRTFVILAGVLLATAAYFRATFELVDNALFVGALVLFGVTWLLRWRRIAPRFTAPAAPVAAALLLSSAIYFALTLPWRLIAAIKIHPGDLRWSTVSDTIAPSRWRPDSTLTGDASFLEQGHVNWACELDRVECARVAALELQSSSPYTGGGHFTNAEFDHLTQQAVISHPFQFLGERFGTLWLGIGTETGSPIGVWSVPETLLILGMLGALIFAFFRRGGFRSSAFGLLALATAVQVGTLALVHVESRYFLGLELSIIVMAALVLGRPVSPPGSSEKVDEQRSESPASP
jgi:hypothetical protein